MELVVVSSPERLKNEANIVNEMFASGLGKFHLRKPDWTLLDVTSLLKQINPDYWHKIALHQYHETAIDFGIIHLHFKEKNRTGICDELFQSFKETGYTLTTSVHELAALKDLFVFNYVFFGSVFDSISKAGYKSKLPVDFNLKDSEKATKIYAIGGVSQDNITSVKEMGFDGAALLGSIWNDPDKAIHNFELIKKLCS